MLLSLIPSGLKVALIVGVVGAVISGGMYFYIQNQNKKMEALQQSVGTLSSVVETQSASINKMTENFVKMARANEELGTAIGKIDQESGELQRLFSDHNLRKLVVGRPGMIEKRANAKTKLEFEELRQITDPSTYFNDGKKEGTDD